MFYVLKRSAIVMLCLFISGIAKSQELKIGDTVPEYFLSESINIPYGKTKLSDLSKRLVIIQFWNTGCGACIRSLKQIDTLQKKFSRDVQFILVSKETKKELLEFFSAYKKIIPPDVPMITGDTMLKKYFPHQFVPHHVWLENGSRVVAITSGYNATTENISAYLGGKSVKLKEISNRPQYELEKPFILYDSSVSNRMFYSYLMPAVDSILGIERREKIFGSACYNRVYMNKMSVIDLFISAFNEGGQYFQRTLNNVVVELRDSSKYMSPVNTTYLDEWQNKHLYLYDIVVPQESADQLYDIMQHELHQLFPLKAYVEQRSVNRLTMIVSNKKVLSGTKGGKPTVSIRKKPADSLWIFQNVPFKSVFSRLRNAFRYGGHELLEETGYSDNVDIILNADAIQEIDIERLNEDLKAYGLIIVNKPSFIDVLVIRDR